MSFGYNLAPSLFRGEREKDFKSRQQTTQDRRGFREINTISSAKERCAAVRRMKEGVCGMQAKEAGILDIEWSQKDHAAFSQACGHQIGMVGDKKEG